MTLTWTGVRCIAALCGLPFASLALVGLCAGSTLPGSLARHLAIPALVPVLVLAAIAPGWWLRTVLLASAVAITIPWLIALRQVPCAPAPVPTAAAFAVASFNCYDLNPNRAAMVMAVADVEADIIALQEVSNSDEQHLIERFPYRAWPHGDGLYQTALVSRYPILTWHLHAFHGYACVEALIATPTGAVRVLAAHVQSPRSGASRANQLSQLQQIAALAASTSGALILLADCNATPADPVWRQLCHGAGLQRPPWGWPATWPAWLGPFGLAIDHVLVRGVALGPLRTLEIPGSDHRGIIAVVQLQ